MEKIIEASDYIAAKIDIMPRFGIVLGSGLGSFAGCLQVSNEIEFGDIPYFPLSTVDGHKGKMVIGNLDQVPVMVLQGRLHYYEGYSMDQVVFPLRCMLYLKVENLVVTSAVGSVDADYKPGELVLIKDHINLTGDNPLRGPNIETFGPRFNDMSQPYPKEIRDLAGKCAEELGFSIKEGVYFYMPGPSYETASEVRAIKILGANLVGMSTAPEVIVAAHGGMNILGISCITNMATGITEQLLGHEEVVKISEMTGKRFTDLLCCIIPRWNEL
jgi:purine-nucleoside phosphorylase